MKDSFIVDLFHSRSDEAVRQSQDKYAAYCIGVADTILHSPKEADECASDAIICAWDTIPPEKPESLGAYLGKLSRIFAIERLRKRPIAARGATFCEIMGELETDLSGHGPEEGKLSAATVNGFLRMLPKDQRMLFVGRYWAMESTARLAERFGIAESAVVTLLGRTRKELANFLDKEGCSK